MIKVIELYHTNKHEQTTTATEDIFVRRNYRATLFDINRIHCGQGTEFRKSRVLNLNNASI